MDPKKKLCNAFISVLYILYELSFTYKALWVVSQMKSRNSVNPNWYFYSSSSIFMKFILKSLLKMHVHIFLPALITMHLHIYHCLMDPKRMLCKFLLGRYIWQSSYTLSYIKCLNFVWFMHHSRAIYRKNYKKSSAHKKENGNSRFSNLQTKCTGVKSHGGHLLGSL